LAAGESNVRPEKVRAPELFVHDQRKVLQHAMPSNGKNAGHQLHLRTQRLQGQDLDSRKQSGLGESAVRIWNPRSPRPPAPAYLSRSPSTWTSKA
jgi:hypothetical protein